MTLACLALLVLATAGCVVTTSRPPLGVVHDRSLGDGYPPLLYDGYVVYFADDGIPYYWRGGNRRWVPPPDRARYLSHWQRSSPAYRNWYPDGNSPRPAIRQDGTWERRPRSTDGRVPSSDLRQNAPWNRDTRPSRPPGGLDTRWEGRHGPSQNPGDRTNGRPPIWQPGANAGDSDRAGRQTRPSPAEGGRAGGRGSRGFNPAWSNGQPPTGQLPTGQPGANAGDSDQTGRQIPSPPTEGGRSGGRGSRGFNPAWSR